MTQLFHPTAPTEGLANTVSPNTCQKADGGFAGDEQSLSLKIPESRLETEGMSEWSDSRVTKFLLTWFRQAPKVTEPVRAKQKAAELTGYE
jgi:hypothetical protein